MDKTRLYAVLILKEVLDGSRWSNKLLPEFRKRLPHHERQRLTELVMGPIKMKLRLDWTIKRYLRRYSLEDLTPPIRNVLRLAAYELLFIEGVPEYASVNEAVKLARRFGHRGVASLVNALLRKIALEKPVPEEPWVLHSHPEWLYKRWKSAFGSEKALAIMKDNNRPAPLYIRINLHRITPEAFKKRLETLWIAYREIPMMKEALSILSHRDELDELRGFFTVQDLSSQLVCPLLSPEKNKVIYDLASAPGGKTTHIAERTENASVIIAMDRFKSRVRTLKARISELGHGSVYPVVGDILNSPLKKMADFILLDVPCSGTGTLKRHPEIKWRLKEKDIRTLARYQLRLIDAASRLLKRGGVMVYSTCTLEREENEGVIENFLSGHGEFILERPVQPELRKLLEGNFLKVDGLVLNSDWAFGARLKRKSA